jgi:bifunctional DNase/RNase
MDKIELKVVGLSYSQTQTGAYALILKEKQGRRRLPIIIGGAEAQAIAIPLEKMTPSRPLTHDLLKSMLDSFSISLHEVVIYNLVEGIFFAKVICQQGSNKIEIDARSSDAVAIALRCEKPIYTHDFILSSAGIIVDEDDSDEITDSDSETDDFTVPELTAPAASAEASSIDELEKQLTLALEREEYEKASKIRDEIKRRRKK